ncbi:MAG: hypothetical protein V2I46_13495 [Bacteroides sp.]|jgi:hypothetical protein|nr:hypothetical protein [Bacteroides sp.]
MKKFKTGGIIFLLALSFLFTGCIKEPYIRFGFDASFSGSSDGLVIMDVGRNANTIHLSGNLFISEGEIAISLISPDGTEVYSNVFSSPNRFVVNETFMATHGYWRLTYESIEGMGVIDIHMITDTQ